MLRRIINSLEWAKGKGHSPLAFAKFIGVYRTFTISNILFQIQGWGETVTEKRCSKELSLHCKIDWFPAFHANFKEV